MIVSVIVTYGNRAPLVKQVINAALAQGVNKIILVDNASTKESVDLLDEMIQSCKEIHLIRHQENEGSAGGFYAGLEYVLNHVETDYIWLLDDDNVPQENALKNLLKARDLVKTEESEEVVLYSYRGNTRPLDFRAVTQGYIKGYEDNNFMGLNFGAALKNKLFKSKTVSNINYPLIQTRVGPYGGMFFSSQTLKVIGLPNKDFYLYADDHEYSLRFSEQGIKQYLVYASQLEDIDISFSEGNIFFSKESSDFKIFYMVRNHVFLSQRFIKSNLKYRFNKMIFTATLFVRSIKFLREDKKYALARINLIKKGIKDGEAARLGKSLSVNVKLSDC